MLTILSGVAIVVASVAGLLYFKPRRGVVHPLVCNPYFESFAAIAITGAFSIGVALIVDGFY